MICPCDRSCLANIIFNNQLRKCPTKFMISIALLSDKVVIDLLFKSLTIEPTLTKLITCKCIHNKMESEEEIENYLIQLKTIVFITKFR